jgi:hypothetical protein
MKDVYIHLINSAIAGSLLFLGSLLPLLTGEYNLKTILLGAGAGLVTGLILFLNKFNEWIMLQDKKCKTKILQFV